MRLVVFRRLARNPDDTRPPQSYSNAPRGSDTHVILHGARATLKIILFTLMVPDAFSTARGATVEWCGQIFRRRGGDQEARVLHVVDVGKEWLVFIAALVSWPFMTLRYLPMSVRGARRLWARLNARFEAGRRLVNDAVFISYHTGEHDEQGHAIARMLSAHGFEVWLDEERGTLPTQLLMLDHVLEAAVRDAGVLLSILSSTGASPAEPDPDEVMDSTVANAIRWVIFVGLAFSLTYDGLKRREGGNGIPPESLALVLQRSTPPSLRRAWYRAMYDLDVEFSKRPTESWSAWERRIAALHGIPVVTVLTDATNFGVEMTADVWLRNPDANSVECQHLMELVSAAQPDPGAAIPAARTQFQQALRKHPYRTLWRVMKIAPSLLLSPSAANGSG